MSTATITRITLAGSPGLNPPLTMSTRLAPTMRIRPSTSKPIWVIQLKKEMGLDPLGPNGARLMAKTDVPASGPCSEHSPSSRKDRLPMTMRESACAKVNPKVIRMAP